MRYLTIATILIVIASCNDPLSIPCENAVRGKVVDLTGLDGCGLVIELANGERLEPMNLNDFEFIEDQEYWVSFSEITEMASICMVGPIVDVVCLEPI